jgi:methylase of polypeptide subunit release factors
MSPDTKVKSWPTALHSFSPATAGAVDLCTGAGAIAAHLMGEVPTATVVGIDIDARAVLCARRNGVFALVAELGEPLRPAIFDLVTAVAPYVPTGKLGLLPADVQRYEPRLALDGGDDGLDLVRRIVTCAARLLRPGGWLLTELGGDQHEALGPTLAASGFSTGTPCSTKTVTSVVSPLRRLARTAAATLSLGRSIHRSPPPSKVREPRIDAGSLCTVTRRRRPRGRGRFREAAGSKRCARRQRS